MDEGVSPAAPRWRKAAVLGVAVASVVAVLAVGAVVLTRAFGAAPGSRPAPAAEPAVSRSASPVPSESPSPAASASLSPSPAPTSARPVVVAPSRKPTQVALPPPPHPPAPPTVAPTTTGTATPGPTPTAPSCPTYSGPAATRSEVRAALDAAAAKHFWPTSAPTIVVPANLLYAVAWQESGWQSTILACDGGIGTVQMMPLTADWMNQRFGTSYDVHTLSGNTMLGGEYLAWLVRYFGDVYFQGSYDLANPALLDSVVAAYNVGVEIVDPTLGEAGIPNWGYVNNVEALMTNCPCLS